MIDRVTLRDESKKPARLACSACGAETEAACACGVAYLAPGERAVEALAKHPEKSNRAIAAEIGVAEGTIRNARKSTAQYYAVVAKRIGKDGKRRRLPKTEWYRAYLLEQQRKARERKREADEAEMAAELEEFKAEAEQLAVDLLKQIDRSLAQRLRAHMMEGKCGETKALLLKAALGRGLEREGDTLDEDIKPEGKAQKPARKPSNVMRHRPGPCGTSLGSVTFDDEEASEPISLTNGNVTAVTGIEGARQLRTADD